MDAIFVFREQMEKDKEGKGLTNCRGFGMDQKEKYAMDDLFDIDIAEFEGIDDTIDDLDFGFETEQQRYINPGKKNIKHKKVKYRNAMELAQKIGNIQRDDRYFVFLDGLFVFGDFLEAWIIKNQYNVLEMTISTLSLSQNNVDSLRTLIEKDYLQNLNIIVSDYFFSHERRQIVPYMYHELDIDNKFQLAVARVHTKVCLIKTECGREIIIHGSANLRTSGNVEQIVIEADADLYEFNYDWHHEIIEKYKTINKSVGRETLWHLGRKNGQNTTQPKGMTGHQSSQKQIGKQTSDLRLHQHDEDQHQPDHQDHRSISRSKAW
jgi:hypothetical protein